MKNSSKLLFYSMMIMSTMMIISSENILSMWMGLEINMISFIPIMFEEKNTSSAESCMIYFLTQSLGSILLLISVLIYPLISIYQFTLDEWVKTLMSSSMLIKLGVPPFHFWFPSILDKMNWENCMILMTWQKIGPLSMLSMMYIPAIQMIIVLSVIVGAMSGLNQTSIRKIMAYSSINHMGWIIACMKMENQLWFKYFMIYSFMIITITMSFNFNSMFFINQMSTNLSGFTEKASITISMMSIGGLPPFLGFLPKWMVIQNMIPSHSFTIITVMIMMSLITLLFYLRLIVTSFTISASTMKWIKSSKNKMLEMMIMVNLSLPLISLMSY
uniref:NADH-ubiquinone oxidoreductase chain 2 n=1 Tax=Neocentrocnemis stali TaxID=888042 RepID=A0A7I6HBQ8_9HEMI|nr:NADH dehydrogenase subunit 2 [Neocentrocnemis stali]AGO28026.1 NADH dehydrogenase subunit 2 [Neocentrocnemis stali]